MTKWATTAGLCLGTLALPLAGCGDDPGTPEAAPPRVVVGAGEPEGPVPHGDHSPKHGGIVLMDGDLHFEVVLGAGGEHRVYFSDATREDLPAAIVDEVRLSVSRTGREPEPLQPEIDEFGESWLARGEPVDDADAYATVGFTYLGKPFEIDVPFVPPPEDPNAPDPHAAMPPPDPPRR